MTTPPCPVQPVMAHFPANRDEAVTLVAVSNAVPLARRLSGEVARHWHLPKLFIEDHETIVSELVTNALKATLAFQEACGVNEVGRIKFKLRLNMSSLFTEVWDINPVLPVRRETDDFSENGRGLGIIEFMCHRWSAAPCREGGKLVWTEQKLS